MVIGYFKNYCVWLCNPMDYSMLGFPVPHYLPEFAQTDSICVSDVIQPSHPLPLPSLPAFNLSPPFFNPFRVFSNEFGFSHRVAKVLAFQLQHQSFLPMNIQD